MQVHHAMVLLEFAQSMSETPVSADDTTVYTLRCGTLNCTLFVLVYTYIFNPEK